MKNKIIYLLIIFVVLFRNSICYAKNISVGGIDVKLNIDVIKQKVSDGKKVKDENKESITKENETEKEAKDKYVNTELVIRNNNPYEKANVTIVEKVNSGFKQIGTNKIDRKISFKVESNKEKIFKYNYKYEKHFILEQFNKLIYEDNVIYDESKNKEDNTYSNKEKDYFDENLNNKTSVENNKIINVENDKRKKIKNSNLLLIIFICIIAGIVEVYGFSLLIRKLNDKDIDFDDYSKFNNFIFIIAASIVLSLVSKTNIYANDYEPIIYVKGHAFTDIIFETVVFNDRYFNFSYEIDVKYENKHEITNYETDTDGDGLSDALEYLYMTDINNADTDGDGLSDYLEVMIFNYNPKSKWTFNDGRNDGYRDYDGDGLSNKKEIELGTDPVNYDTDGDNLSDYEEVKGVKSRDGLHTYYTDPLKTDTDDDGLNDDVEIILGLDPTNPMTDGITPDNKRKIEQNYKLSQIPKILREGDIFIKSISGKVSGNINNNIKITEYHSNSLYNVTSLVSPTFNILNETNDDIEVIFDVKKVSNRIENLMIIKFVDGKLKAIDTDFENDEISAKINNGIYGIVDCDYIMRDLNLFVNDYLE